MTEVLHYFEWLDYDKIKNIGINYTNVKPLKNDNNVYLSNIDEPLKFYLPKSQVENLYKDEMGAYYIDYKIDDEEHCDFIEFLEHLDSLCIEEASKNSINWFKQNLEEETLVKYYNSIYTVEEKTDSDNESDNDDASEKIYLPINIDPDSINDINRFNSDNSAIIIVKITGIEFFKKTFRWRVEYEDILYETYKANEYDSDEIDFSEIIRGDNDDIIDNNETIINDEDNISEKVQVNKENEQNSNSKENLKNCDINSTIDNLAEEDSSSTVEETVKLENSDVKLNQEALDEITSIISHKKSEVRKYQINSERAKKASESLSLKVDSVNNEISIYEEKLRVLSQSNN
tara:strand:- start:144 stop:1181 length:1038 start_codon:yes stop_codon:yes gene_type:complete